MLATRRNPYLFSPATGAPVGGGSAPKQKAPAPAAGAETDEVEDPDDEVEEEEEIEEEEEEDTDDEPDPPAAATPAKLSVMQRGAMMARKKGDLIAEIAQLRGEVAARDARIATLAAKAAGALQLQQENAQLRKDLKASKAYKNTVEKGVQKGLAALGVPAGAAPAPVGQQEADKTMTRAEFDKLDHNERNTRMKAGWKVTSGR